MVSGSVHSHVQRPGRAAPVCIRRGRCATVGAPAREHGMIRPATIREWRDHDVVDRRGTRSSRWRRSTWAPPTNRPWPPSARSAHLAAPGLRPLRRGGYGTGYVKVTHSKEPGSHLGANLLAEPYRHRANPAQPNALTCGNAKQAGIDLGRTSFGTKRSWVSRAQLKEPLAGGPAPGVAQARTP
jgi:hypothetical protein